MNLHAEQRRNRVVVYRSLEEALGASLRPESSARILRHELAAGEIVEPHFHPSADETIYFLSGNAVVQVENEEHSLQEGQGLMSVTIGAGQIHSLRASTRADYYVVRQGEEGTVYTEVSYDKDTVMSQPFALSHFDFNERRATGVADTVSDFSLTANVCQQKLKELWRESGLSSLAHVEMDAGAVSLLHLHERMTEVYFGLSGTGILEVGGEHLFFEKDSIVTVPAGTPHKLYNMGGVPLVHLVLCAPAFDPNDVVLLEVLADA